MKKLIELILLLAFYYYLNIRHKTINDRKDNITIVLITEKNKSNYELRLYTIKLYSGQLNEKSHKISQKQKIQYVK